MKRKRKIYKSGKVFYSIGKLDKKSEMKMDFSSSLRASLQQRLNRSFIKTYKPVIDDAPYRVFDTMKEYKKWSNNLPKWLGYGKTD